MAVERAERGIERRPAGRRRRRRGGGVPAAPGPESAAAVSPAPGCLAAFRDCSCRVSRYPSMNLYTKHAVGPIAHTNIKRNSK